MTGIINYLSKSIKALQAQQKDMQVAYDSKIQKFEQKCSSLEQHALYSDAKLKKVSLSKLNCNFNAVQVESQDD